ncbi:EscU/YscU/HrcU family type III secretion system export apparatus switch protein [Azospirillum thermophilum]|uniref:Flagellar biosynthetic protein FlhB n=1 Tax=Azospirillum thermophilum TaxID=2202148 RepID=A0A2S2CUQ6_9PROT|nr:flagellar type III secretion system protein FlhB [Azospirillum thermophilum]AWK88242.1 flagellar biosynthesis protein FlhB [Azospirillum thermophilum]
MADEQDNEQKTEEPTEKRLRDALEKGDVPRARDVGLLAGMAAAWLIVAAGAPRTASGVAEVLLPLIENPDDFRLDGSAYDVLHGLSWVIGGIGVAMLPVLGILLAGAAASALGQGPLVSTTERIRPKLSNISLRSGWRRIFSRTALIEFCKSLAKLTAIAGAVWFAVAPYIRWTEGIVGMDVAALPNLLRDLTLRLLLAVLLATVLMAAVDVLWNRLEWRKRLRMTFQELKDEYKQTEGDPHLKARLREIRRDRSRRRMMAAVPRATVVIANPTHFAVALEYDRSRMPAPICLAKGADLVALRIRTIAEENGVPVIENPPLARALYASAEIDKLIPLQHYQAVAEVMMYVLRLKGGTARRTGS